MNTARFGILRHQPYPNRSEHINIGLVVFAKEGIRVHMAHNLKKLKAFDPSADIDATREQESSIVSLVKGMSENDAHILLQNFGTWRLSDKLGFFDYRDADEYDYWIDKLLTSTVEPREKGKTLDRPIKSKLSIDLRKTLDKLGWLGKQPSDIKKNKIVPRYPVSTEDGVYAELAMENGKLHIIETVDFRHITNLNAKRQETQSKALIFDFADMLQEDKGTNNIVIVAAADYNEVKPLTNLLRRYAHVAQWESQTEMNEFFRVAADAIHQPMLEIPMH
jgi:hypothetical protein